MFASRGWMRFALLLNLVGTVMLFLSFQATSSKIKIISTPDGNTALCVSGWAIFVANEKYATFSSPCPEWQNARSVAVVNIEKPILVTVGFSILTMGFLLQFLSIPSPKTVAQMRKDLKDVERAEKLRKRIEQHQQSNTS